MAPKVRNVEQICLNTIAKISSQIAVSSEPLEVGNPVAPPEERKDPTRPGYYTIA